MNIDPLRLIQRVTKIASLPDVCLKLGEAINDPKTSNNDIENILSEDMAMASRVLKIANSAMYSFPSRVDKISQAVNVIGYKQLQTIVLGCSIVDMFKGLPQDVVDMESFWKHSIACGVASRILASHRREADVEHFFAAGLLHDIGRLIIFMELPNQSVEIISRCNKTGEEVFNVEREILGFDHAKLGGLLLKSWKLPVRLVDSITYHHKPLFSQDHRVETSIVHVADILCHALRCGQSGEPLVPVLNDEAWKSLDLSLDVVSPTIEQITVQVSDMEKTLLQDVA